MTRRRDPSAGDAGFTLIEIMVGLAISALLMVGISMTMRTVNVGWRSQTDAIERQAMMATGLRVIEADLSRIERIADNRANPHNFLFAGNATQLAYVLAERDGHNTEGLYWVRLLVRTADGGGTELVRMRAPFTPGPADFAAIKWTDEVVLLHGAIGVEISYRAPRSDVASWVSEWNLQNRMPQQIRFDLTDRQRHAPLLPSVVFSIWITAESNCFVPASPGCTMTSQGVIAAREEDK